MKTYVDANELHMWDSLFDMCDLFNHVALKVSSHCGYSYDQKEHEEIVAYLKAVKQDHLNKERELGNKLIFL